MRGKTRSFHLYIPRAHFVVCRKQNDHKILGSSGRWLQREVEDDEAMKERKEMMTIVAELRDRVVCSTS